VRYDPISYTANTVMDIYGMMSNDCIMKLSYAADTLTVSEVIDLSTFTYRFYTITPEHFDVT